MNEHHIPNPRQTDRARTLRHHSTGPERALWALLRRKQMLGLRFRRQHPIEPYVVDFYCPAARLVIEIDGMSHVGQREYDNARATFLKQRGLRVLRFTNDDVLQHRGAVGEAILHALKTHATPKHATSRQATPVTPSPSPSRGEGGRSAVAGWKA